MASDGVWEFLSNEKVRNIVDQYYKFDNAIGAADKLIEESVRSWRRVSLICLIIYNRKMM